jgi:hypothetical protein
MSVINLIERTLRFVILALAMLVASVIGYSTSPNIESADAAQPTAWAVCSWTGVRDGVLGPAVGSSVILIKAQNLTLWGDSRWVGCRTRWFVRVGEFTVARCHNWIVHRPTDPPAYHLGAGCADDWPD